MKSKTKASCYRMCAVYYPAQRFKFAHLLLLLYKFGDAPYVVRKKNESLEQWILLRLWSYLFVWPSKDHQLHRC